MHNRADYNVRGYSHGFYRRGQDSAGLLIYEQSCRNVVAYNSMTHGGDGLFLWAGQSTMDTGEGGANDNLFYGNDFSFAPTNGMEATFSRNTFVDNRIEGSDTACGAATATIRRSSATISSAIASGIAIEHGQNEPDLVNRSRGLHRHPPVGERHRAVRLGISEAPRHAESRLPDHARTFRASGRRSCVGHRGCA